MNNTKYKFRYEVGDILHMPYHGSNVLITELVDGSSLYDEPKYRYLVLTSPSINLKVGEENWSFADTFELHSRKLN